MAALFDDAIAAVVAYRTTHQPDHSSPKEFAWAVGPRPDDPEAADTWDQAVEALRAAAIPAATRHVEQQGFAGAHAWTPEQCERLLRRGTLGDVLRTTNRLAHLNVRPAPPTLTL